MQRWQPAEKQLQGFLMAVCRNSWDKLGGRISEGVSRGKGLKQPNQLNLKPSNVNNS